MIVEGKGLQAPSPWVHQLTRSELILSLNTATRIANFRQYRGSRQQWKRGLTEAVKIPGIADYIRSDMAPYIVGYSGEIAVAIFFGRSIDDRLLNGGDGGSDITINRSRMQIKTRRHTSSSSREKMNLIRVVQSSGASCWPSAPLLVFCEVDTDCWKSSILGWCRTDKIKSLPIVDARKGDHKNVEVSDSFLEPISALRSIVCDAN